jgi:hypothetical protein
MRRHYQEDEMTDSETFEAWWALTKPAEVDDYRPHFEDCWQAATLAERERCAKVCDEWTKANHVYVNGAIRCAAAIRSKS